MRSLKEFPFSWKCPNFLFQFNGSPAFQNFTSKPKMKKDRNSLFHNRNSLLNNDWHWLEHTAHHNVIETSKINEYSVSSRTHNEMKHNETHNETQKPIKFIIIFYNESLPILSNFCDKIWPFWAWWVLQLVQIKQFLPSTTHTAERCMLTKTKDMQKFFKWNHTEWVLGSFCRRKLEEQSH